MCDHRFVQVIVHSPYELHIQLDEIGAGSGGAGLARSSRYHIVEGRPEALLAVVVDYVPQVFDVPSLLGFGNLEHHPLMLQGRFVYALDGRTRTKLGVLDRGGCEVDEEVVLYSVARGLSNSGQSRGEVDLE